MKFDVSINLSDLPLIYCGKAGFRQTSRLYSLINYGSTRRCIFASKRRRICLKLSLDRLVNSLPEVLLCPTVSSKFKRQLPFLLKVLFARKPLSIQAHPNRG